MPSQFVRSPSAARVRTVAAGSNGEKLYWLLYPEDRTKDIDIARLDQQVASGRATILNRYAGIWNDQLMVERLRLCGIPVRANARWGRHFNTPGALQQTRYVRTVVFWVFGSEVIAAGISSSQSAGSGIVHRIGDWSRPPYRRLARLAVRAAYALGYDTLQVALQAAAEHMQASSTDTHDATEIAGGLDQPLDGDAVVQAMPVKAGVPVWVWGQYAARVRQHAREVTVGLTNEEISLKTKHNRNQEQITFGLDGEFILYSPERNKLVSADRFFPLAGSVGCDAVRINGRVLYPLMELRPAPAETPERLVKHVQTLMREAMQTLVGSHDSAALHWLAGSMPKGRLPIGCHVHFSGTPLNAELIRALDTYVALPVSLLEPVGVKRRLQAYGMPGDVRMQDHNGAGGFEYRTLPNFLHTPELALDVLRLIEVVSYSYTRLTQRDAVEDKVLRAIVTSKGIKPVGLRETALKLLEQAKAYCFHEGQQHSILRLSRYIETGWTWQEDADIRPSWLWISEGSED